MKYLPILMFALLAWFAIEVFKYENEQQSACDHKGGVLMYDRNSEYICVKKEAIVK